MAHREQQFQSLNICQRLHNFTKFLARYAYKTVISGRPLPHRLAPPVPKEASSRSSQVVHPIAQRTQPDEDKDKSSSNAAPFASNSDEKKGVELEEAAAIGSSASEQKVPKKMVSINENVETISTSNKKKSKKKKKEKEILDDSMPLKSILKVSSDINNTTDDQSLLSRANGA